MRPASAALGAALLLAGCSTAPTGMTAAQQTASTLVAAYTVAANAAGAYVAAQPSAAPLVRACDNTAWAGVGPVAQALAKGADPTTAEMGAAQAAISALSPCLTAAGVKP